MAIFRRGAMPHLISFFFGGGGGCHLCLFDLAGPVKGIRVSLSLDVGVVAR